MRDFRKLLRRDVGEGHEGGFRTDDGAPITRDRVEGILAELLATVDRFDGDRFDDAADVFRDVALRDEFPTFLTVGAYSRFLVELE